MNRDGFKPCPKCGSEDIDYGFGTGTNKYMLYAQCESCGYIRWVPVHRDMYEHLRWIDNLHISRDAWNDEVWEDE